MTARNTVVAVKEERADLFNLVNDAPMGMFRTNVEGKLLWINSAALSEAGYKSLEEMNRIGVSNFYAELSDRERLMEGLKNGPVSGFETKFRRSDGSVVDVSISARLIFDQTGKPLFIEGCIENVTAKKLAEKKLRRAEEQLRQSQKMEAMGRMAQGVAHDFNNLIAAIMGYSDIALINMKKGKDVRAEIEGIAATAEQAASLAKRLLVFGRAQLMQPTVVDLNEIVAATRDMIIRLVGNNVSVVERLSLNLWKTTADPGQLESVIANLAINARDAMSDGGVIAIETANVEPHDRLMNGIADIMDCRHVMLSVADTGVGMSDEIREKIFEPFFTTKDPEKGTGLGLSVVYGIVKQSDGQIVVESEPGRGSVFRVFFPALD